MLVILEKIVNSLETAHLLEELNRLVVGGHLVDILGPNRFSTITGSSIATASSSTRASAGL